MKRLLLIVMLAAVLTVLGYCYGYRVSDTNYFQDEVTDYYRYYNEQPKKHYHSQQGAAYPFAYNEKCSLYEDGLFEVYGIFPRITRFSIFVDCKDKQMIFQDFEIILVFYGEDNRVVGKESSTLHNVKADEIHELKFKCVEGAQYVAVYDISYALMDPDSLLAVYSAYELPARIKGEYCDVTITAPGSNRVAVTGDVKQGYSATISLLNRHYKELEQISISGKSTVNLRRYTDYGLKYCTVLITQGGG